jgi:6-phosphofructokinase 1
VQFAFWDGRDGSVTIHRTGRYAVEYRFAALEDVAAKTRTMPDAFIAENGTDVTEAFRRYLRPLLGRDMPQAGRLRLHRVPPVANGS